MEILKKAWDEGSYTIAPDADPSQNKSDVVGRIITSDAVTNQQGQASVTIEAPIFLERTVAVLMKVDDDILGSGFAIANFETPGLDEGSIELSLNTSGGLTESSGNSFNMWINGTRLSIRL